MKKTLCALLVVVGVSSVASVASAAALVKVSSAQHSAAVKAVNDYLKSVNGSAKTNYTILINDKGRGLAFNKKQIDKTEIENPIQFSVGKSGKIEVAGMRI